MTVSHALSGSIGLLALPMAAVCVSSITKAEPLFGLARRPEAKRLHTALWKFLRRVDVLPWDSELAERNGATRAALERQCKILGPVDLLIAAHGLCAGELVTNERAFAQVDGLRVESWTADAA
jgi:tRNA(fMet)-specific endonuclease VapC